MLQVSIVCKTLLLTVCRWCAAVARRNVAVFVQCTRWLVASHKRWLALVAALRVCSLLRNAVNGPLFVAAAQRLARAPLRGAGRCFRNVSTSSSARSSILHSPVLAMCTTILRYLDEITRFADITVPQYSWYQPICTRVYEHRRNLTSDTLPLEKIPPDS